MKIDLLEFFKNVEDEMYCIIKGIELENYKQGSDIDIFCFDIGSFSKKIITTVNKYISYGYIVKINDTRKEHWHIDLIKDNQIEIRFDLYGAMPNYKKILVKDALFSSIVENRIIKEAKGVQIYHQSFIDEILIRYLEYIENYKLRPDKVKHLDYILDKIKEDSDNKKFLDKLHYYTKLPQILEIEKRNNTIELIREIIVQIKATPFSELPKKTIKFFRKRVSK